MYLVYVGDRHFCVGVVNSQRFHIGYYGCHPTCLDVDCKTFIFYRYGYYHMLNDDFVCPLLLLHASEFGK
ncbi:unnamed protein product [Sphenostylis stenocarpa]|uniref:Uncharacterized protein n=1 Tax=Sphenostylis stenocarpa TaxID=92480 RepID=A0AA86SP85_9FABA|nr:unnamed protein product [Sphenostylis stenocarpa]